MFDKRIKEKSPFIPHSFAEIERSGALPPGAVPESVYLRLEKNYASLEDVTVSKIIYDSEGFQVSGVMVEPKQSGAKPIVIYNRGGFREYGKLTIYTIMQMLVPLAQAGYVVFASNYRGNDGSEGEDEFGGAEVEDVLALLDIARAHSEWDGKNAYMVGHSRGGMMTTLALKHGASVNAAVSIAGIADMVTHQKDWEKLVPPAEGAFAARSSVCWPEQINVPLLLLHGDADDKVSLAHSQAFANALEESGKEYKLIVYPGGNHALIRHWQDVLDQIKSWCARYRV